jgi:hypothetical protein
VIWVAVIAAVGVGILICVAADCFEDDDEDLPD